MEGQHVQPNILHCLVKAINDDLIARGLPAWLIEANDADLKTRAAWHERGFVDGCYDDYGNDSASSLMLAMITPGVFGIEKCQALYPRLAHANLTFISGTRPHSGTGIDNQRGNCIESLLNCLPRFDPLRDLIQKAWVMAARAWEYERYRQEHRFIDALERTKLIFGCAVPIDDEEWWPRIESWMQTQQREQQSLEAKSYCEAQVEELFIKIFPKLSRSYHENNGMTNRQIATIAELQSANGKTVKRLREKWEDWRDGRRNVSNVGIWV